MLDLVLPPHRTAAVWLLFHIHQADRNPAPRVLGAAPTVMQAESTLWINCPACVVGSIATFKDITKTGHGRKRISILPFIAPPEDPGQSANLPVQEASNFRHFLPAEFW